MYDSTLQNAVGEPRFDACAPTVSPLTNLPLPAVARPAAGTPAAPPEAAATQLQPALHETDVRKTPGPRCSIAPLRLFLRVAKPRSLPEVRLGPGPPIPNVSNRLGIFQGQGVDVAGHGFKDHHVRLFRLDDRR